MTSYNADYENVLLYLDLVEKNTQQYFKMVRITLERMRELYEKRIQEISQNNNGDETWPNK